MSIKADVKLSGATTQRPATLFAFEKSIQKLCFLEAMDNLFSVPNSSTSSPSPILHGRMTSPVRFDVNDDDIFEREFLAFCAEEGGASSSATANNLDLRKPEFGSYAAAALAPVSARGDGGVGDGGVGDDDAETFCDERGGGWTSDNKRLLDKLHRSIKDSMRCERGDNHGDCCGDQPRLSEEGYAYVAWHPTKSLSPAMEDVVQEPIVTEFRPDFFKRISKMDDIPVGCVVSGPVPYDGPTNSWKSTLGQLCEDSCEDLKRITECKICHHLVHNPCKTTETCSMHYCCRSCLYTHWNASRISENLSFSCPVCRAACSEIGTFADTSANRDTNMKKKGEIQMLHFVLEHFAFFSCKACEKTRMSYQENLEHTLQECKNTPVYCPNSKKTRSTSSYSQTSSSSSTCNAIVNRGDLSAHLLKCPGRKIVKCGLCDSMVSMDSLLDHVTKHCNSDEGRAQFMCNHGDQCQCSDVDVPPQVKQSDIYFGLIFPQLYDKNVLPRPLLVDRLSEYRPTCAYRFVKCEIPKCPCDNIRFHEMSSHIEDNQAQHQNLLRDEIAKNKEAMREVEAEIQASCEEEKRALEELQRQTTERMERLKRKLSEDTENLKREFERNVGTKKQRFDALFEDVKKCEEYLV